MPILLSLSSMLLCRVTFYFGIYRIGDEQRYVFVYLAIYDEIREYLNFEFLVDMLSGEKTTSLSF